MSSSARSALIWFAVALIPRAAYLLEQGASSVLFFQPLLDEYELARTADDLLAGRGFGPEPLFKAPLYPVLLAAVKFLCGDAWFWGIRAFQHLCGALLATIAFDAARRLRGPGRRGAVAGHAAAFCIAFHAPLIRLECQVLLDAVAVFLQSAMLWMLLRWRCAGRSRAALAWLVGAGLCAALAWLNRPTITVAIPFVAAWILGARADWRCRNARLAPALRAATTFVALPIAAAAILYARNAVVGGEAMVLPWQGGVNLYAANARDSDGRYFSQKAFAVSETGNPVRAIAETEFLAAVRRGEVPEPPAGRRFGAIDDWWNERAMAEIRADPSRWLGLMAGKALDLTSDREIFNIEDYDVQKRLSNVLRWIPLSYGWIWPPALASLALLPLLPRRRRALAGLVWTYAVFLAGGIALYYTSGRLRMPLAFPAALLAATSVACVVEGVRARSPKFRRVLAPAAILLAAGIAMSWGDWRNVRSESFAHAEYARLSNAAWRAGRSELALEYANECDRARPGYPAVPQLRAQAFFSLGRFAEAETAYAAATRAIPNDPVSPYNLGIVRYYHSDRVAEAIEAFEEALRRKPDYRKAEWMIALSRARLGDLAAAKATLSAYDETRLDANAPVELLVAFAAIHCLEGDAAARARIEAFLAADAKKAASLRDELRTAGCVAE